MRAVIFPTTTGIQQGSRAKWLTGDRSVLWLAVKVFISLITHQPPSNPRGQPRVWLQPDRIQLHVCQVSGDQRERSNPSCYHINGETGAVSLSSSEPRAGNQSHPLRALGASSARKERPTNVLPLSPASQQTGAIVAPRRRHGRNTWLIVYSPGQCLCKCLRHISQIHSNYHVSVDPQTKIKGRF